MLQKLKNPQILKVIYIFEMLFFAIIVTSILLRALDLSYFFEITYLYKVPATLAFLILPFTLIPGAMQRLGAGKDLYNLMIYYRRAIGILFYIAATTHFMLIMQRSFIFNPSVPKTLDLMVMSGTIAFTIFFPVFITSNNISQRFFKRNWKKIQRITYLGYVVVMMHFFFIEQFFYLIIYTLIGILVIYSWIVKKSATRKAKLQNIQ